MKTKIWIKVLLIGAYALMLLAVLACAALFGVQTVRNGNLKEENALLQQTMEEQSGKITALEEQNTALSEQVKTLEQKLADEQSRAAELEEQNALAQQELADALRYTMDVRKEDAGTIVSLEEIDPDDLARYFTSEKIEKGDQVYQRIIGKSYVENKDIGLDELRYMKVLHYNFDHKVQVGELIVHRELVTDYQEIFLELFRAEYEINSLYLIDNFWTGDGLESDSASIDANNSSAFCYRRVAGGSGLSNHALGRAIDINPQQNPYVTFDSKGKPKWTHDNADDYIDRDTGLPHVITHEDLLYKLFKEHGFDWGGDWKTLKDYQHFDKEN